jgi:aspartyl-tRNA(Asn)/glutamyl-tRNA(Gln) amidotransferase subunit A
LCATKFRCLSLSDCLTGPDDKDSTCLPEPKSDISAAQDWVAKGVRVGVPVEYDVKELAPEIRALWQQGLDRLKAAGATIVPISLPHTKFALPAYYIIATAEASSNLSRYDGVRYGMFALGPDYERARQRTHVCRASSGDGQHRSALLKEPLRRLRGRSPATHSTRHICAIQKARSPPPPLLGYSLH